MTTSLSPRGSLGWLGALLAGGMSAAFFGVAFAYADTMLVFIAYFSALPLFVAGLGAGLLPGAFAGLIGGGALFLKMSPQLAVSYLILNAFPVAMLIALALRYRAGEDRKIYWYPEGYLLTATVLYPCMLFLLAMALAWGQEGGLLGQTTQMLQDALSPIAEQLPPEQVDNFKVLLGTLPRVFPALMGCAWVFLMIISAAAAQSTLKGQRWNLREAFTWRDLRLPGWLLIAAAVTGLVAALAPEPFDYAGLNICFMLCIPFFFVGLAVAHAYAATIKMGLMFLIFFYILLAILPWLALVVTLLGALEQVMNFRQRLAALPPKSDTRGDNQ